MSTFDVNREGPPVPGASPAIPAVPAAVAQPAGDTEGGGTQITPLEKPDNVPYAISSPFSRGAVAYLAIYDPEALHEAQQPIYHPQVRSGGVAYYVCAVTAKGVSIPLDPQPAPARPPS